MKEKKIKLYKFEELDEDTQEKVLNKFRELQDFPFLYEYLFELLKEKLKENNIECLDEEELALYYSLSHCQGDGLNFQGLFRWKDYAVKIKSSRTSIGTLYNHKYSVDIEVFKEDGETIHYNYELDKEGHDTEAEFKDIYYKICDELEKVGYDYIEYEQSEENIKEIIKVNDYWFRENGEIER